MATELIFLKLGGSLITDKSQAHTVDHQHIQRLAEEIQHLHQSNPELRIIIGHGSGSFGHITGNQYHTRNGVHSPEEWLGFAEVWKAANALHTIMINAFYSANLPVVSFPPSAMVLSKKRQIIEWDLNPLQSALRNGLIPVIQGDVVFDTELGGTILSTEELFVYLARQLSPQRILLAGQADGVFADFPVCKEIISILTPQTLDQFTMNLAPSENTDVTGGMRSKVLSMIDLVKQLPELSIHIFSGRESTNLRKIINGVEVGTLIKAD